MLNNLFIAMEKESLQSHLINLKEIDQENIQIYEWTKLSTLICEAVHPIQERKHCCNSFILFW